MVFEVRRNESQAESLEHQASSLKFRASKFRVARQYELTGQLSSIPLRIGESVQVQKWESQLEADVKSTLSWS